MYRFSSRIRLLQATAIPEVHWQTGTEEPLPVPLVMNLTTYSMIMQTIMTTIPAMLMYPKSLLAAMSQRTIGHIRTFRS